ncbi:hypothetical protein DFH11DRAFT_1571461 [Phellopilus nigrolimitatus]|nr:hypothetical protein DFH11DRAFT_1571461 [Phellopilus nigrolimitatus]
MPPLCTSEILEKSATLPKSSASTPRRRRPAATRTIYVATGSPGPRKGTGTPRVKPPPARRPAPPQQLVSDEELNIAFKHGARSSARYVHEVGGWFFYLLKWPLAVLLVLWAVAFILNTLSSSMRTAFSPLCILPGISRSSLCASPQTYGSQTSGPAGPAKHADYPKMVEIQSKTFEQLLDESLGGSSLAVEIKKAEMAAADLVTVVRTSDLRSKDILADTLASFSQNARSTARGLDQLNAKVGGSVDNIVAISDYTLRTIEDAEARKSSLMVYIWPFGSRNTDTELLASAFTQSLSVLSTSLERLIFSAEASLNSLNMLEEQLGTIHGIVTREDASITAQQSELLADLWTILGGNRAQVQRFSANLQALRALSGYRAQALAHVVAALHALHTLSADMEELRQRAAAPELTGGEIPIEVHARALRSGVQRLTEGRLKSAKRIEESVKGVSQIFDSESH